MHVKIYFVEEKLLMAFLQKRKLHDLNVIYCLEVSALLNPICIHKEFAAGEISLIC